jgi:hypothetical protein
MIDPTVASAAYHPALAFWLDVFDKAIKFVAVALGGLWTYWNYLKGRTYAQKLELELAGNVFFKDDLYVDVATSLRNTGASIFPVQQEGTSCTLSAVLKDLSIVPVRVFPIFTKHNQMEPGDSIHDACFWRVARPSEDMVWLKIDLRIVSGKVEWNSVALMRIAEENPAPHANHRK